jgi:hypothetical protein
MPYVRRNAEGSPASLHRQPEADADEFLPDDHPEVLAFVGQDSSAADAGAGAAFAQLDADFIRVLEDLIDVLIRGKVINITDLPMQARQKLYSRKGHRANSTLTELNLLGDQGDQTSLGGLGGASLGDLSAFR